MPSLRVWLELIEVMSGDASGVTSGPASGVASVRTGEVTGAAIWSTGVRIGAVKVTTGATTGAAMAPTVETTGVVTGLSNDPRPPNNDPRVDTARSASTRTPLLRSCSAWSGVRYAQTA